MHQSFKPSSLLRKDVGTKMFPVSLLLLCSVSTVTFVTAESNVSWFNNGTRFKRQDKWSWGNEENRQNRQMNNPPPPQADEDPNVCAPYNPPIPNFNKPGRRVSETKCYEYVWQMKYREEKAQKEKACIAYNRRKAGLHFRNLVVGGRRARSGEYPHMGAIGWKATQGTWVFKCGGALISPNFVLTAAHCARAPRDSSLADPEPKIVRLGDTNILDIPNNGVKPQDEIIMRIIQHPSYSSPRKYNDIALIQLSKNVELSKLIQPACLWQTGVDPGKATITGWGVVETAGRTTSPDLQTAEVDVINTSTCNGLLRRWCNRLWCGLQNQLCAGQLTGGVDSCQGDSGGPLQVKIPVPAELGSMHYIVGVTSFGFGCARADAPGVYTKVASYLDWIESVVWS